MIFGFNANASSSTSEQISNVYTETDKFLDQSVKDTTIQNYISSLISRTSNKDEIIQNFQENIESAADSVQQNKLTLEGCMELDTITINQTNNLVQETKQGFEKLFEEISDLKQALGMDMTTDTTADQSASAKQGSTGSSNQDQSITQDTKQTTDQKATFIPRLIPPIGPTLSASQILLTQTDLGKAKIRPEAFSMFGKKKRNTIRKEHPVDKIEHFSLFGTDVNLSHTSSTQESNATAIDKQTIIQSQDIYKKIDTAYDKTVEIIKEVSKVYNETINSIATAKSVQINELVINNKNACMLKLKGLDLTQTNTLQQSAELQTVIKNMNDMKVDNETKAIVADMLGLTQSTETDQTGKLETIQTTDTSQKTTQETTQVADSSSGSLGVIIVVIILAVVGFIAYKVYSSALFDSYFDEEVGGVSGKSNQLSILSKLPIIEEV